MALIHWKNAVSGSFTNAADWVGGVVPDYSDGVVLDAAGAAFTVTSSTYEGVASLQTAANATLALTGASLFDVGGFDGGGTSTNAGAISIGAGSRFEVYGAFISTGMITLGAGSQFKANGASTNAGAITIGAGGYLDVIGGFISTGTITLGGAGSLTTLEFNATGATLRGAGSVTLSDNHYNRISNDYTAGVLTNVSQIISGAGVVDCNLKNEAAGVIDATGANYLYIAGYTTTNAGLMEATGAGGLKLLGGEQFGGSFTNTGTLLAADGGTVFLSNTIVNAGAGFIEASGSGSTVDFGSATVVGGVLKTVDGGIISVTGRGGLGATGSTTTNLGVIGIDNFAALTLYGVIDNAGAINVNASSNYTYLGVDGHTTLTDGGEVVLSDNRQNKIDFRYAYATLTNVNNTISGAGQIGSNHFTLINQKAGVIDASATNNALFIHASGNVTNAGLIEATGAGGLVLDNGTVNNAGGVILAAAGANIDLQTLVINGGTLRAASGGAIHVDTGTPVTLQGVAIVDAGVIETSNTNSQLTLANSAVTGTGTLLFIGAIQALNGGTTISVSKWSLSGNDFVTLNEGLTYGGSFSAGVGTNLDVSSGHTLTLSGASSLAGTVSGGGALVFAGGSQSINTGASLTVAHWFLTGGVTTIAANLTYKGAFTEAAGAVLTLATGDKLTLAGAANLAGIVRGASRLAVSAATVSGLLLGGTTILEATGKVSQTGAFTVGDKTSSAATLTIDAGAAWTIAGGGGIGRGNSSKSVINVKGSLTNTETGTTVVAVKVVDTGSMTATTGTLDFTSGLSGTGSMSVNSGATLEADLTVASTLSMTFNGGDATLALKDPSAFAATITGFAPTDTIDLLGKTATKAALGAGDTLVITNGGKHVATLQLAGDYTGDTFAVAADGNGGTDITVTGPGAGPPPAAPASRPALAFVSAAACLAGRPGAAGPAQAPHEAPRPFLAAPGARTA